jgi:hypothetical protein
MIFCHHHQLLRIRICGLFQFRITSEIMNQFRHLAELLGCVNDVFIVIDICKRFTRSRPVVILNGT